MKQYNMLLLLGFLAGDLSHAQNVGIGTNAPHASAALDVQSPDRGMLIPRLALVAANVAAPVIDPQEVEQTSREVGYDFSGVDLPKNENDFYGLRYAEFVVPLVKAVQEQQALIQSQQWAIEELQKQLVETQKMLTYLSNSISGQ